MNRKRLYILSVCLCLVAIVRAQYDIVLGSSQTHFTVFVNNQDMTCEIRDDNHEIDDRTYVMKKNERSMRGFKHMKGTRTLVIPERIIVNRNTYVLTCIGRAAFAGYDNVDYIILPNTVTKIDDYAFFRSSIRGIEIPPSVTEMGKRVFGYCQKLTNITSAMGGVNISKKDYAESKGCKQTFKSKEEYASAGITIPTATSGNTGSGNKKPTKKMSDVDYDLPATENSNDNLFAVIIANENYQKVSPVDYAMHDGQTFKQYCLTVLGIPESNISFIPNATLLNMNSEVDHMKNIADAYSGNARFIFYYAGHGFPNDRGTESFLLPIDGSGMNVKEGFSLKELYGKLGELNAKSVVVMMDACFSGSQRGNGMLVSARAVAVKAATSEPKGNMVVFSAASNDETANPYPEEGHGLFTYFMLKKLKENPNTTLGELETYINSEVRKYSIVKIRKSQTPTVSVPASLSSRWRNMTLK